MVKGLVMATATVPMTTLVLVVQMLMGKGLQLVFGGLRHCGSCVSWMSPSCIKGISGTSFEWQARCMVYELVFVDAAWLGVCRF